MDLTWEKWLVMAALALISIFLGMLPYLVLGSNLLSSLFSFISPNTRTNEKPPSIRYKMVLTMLSCFGGGVLLATAIVHMLTEAREDLAAIPEISENFESDYPLAEILTLIGFSVIYLVEEVAHFIMAHEHPHSHHHHQHNEHHRGSRNSIAHSISMSHRKMSIVSTASSMEEGATCSLDGLTVPTGGPGSTFNEKIHHHHHHHDEDEQELQEKQAAIGSTLRSLLALIALSFHAVMEGVAIGIQETTGVWFMFGAVASHKFVISFCMGMELFASQAKMSTYLGSIIFFAVVSPLGILIGSLLSGSSTNVLPIAIIKGLATGTLLYVVFFEILSREKEKQTAGNFIGYTRLVGFLQFLSMVLGMVSMVILVTQVAHSHSDDDHSEGTTEGPHEPHEQTAQILTTMTERLLTII